jgi:hypothetical protein
VEPIHPSAVRELEETVPPETEAESLANEKAAGFSYRSSIGELLYAYVTCRLDILVTRQLKIVGHFCENHVLSRLDVR